jgi:3-hydroxymyristoyl/3-hydroxydecanoyl-(acyl carrier protein) dehydratase
MSLMLTFADPHPACDGHFPGNPVLPAVVLLDAVLRRLQEATGTSLTVASAKFLKPVLPGQTVALQHTQSTGGAMRFTLAREGQTVASGVLRPA